MLSIDAWLDEKPYKEVYDGIVHEKVSPFIAHGIVAGEAYAVLRDWGNSRGVAVIEWRVYLAPGITLVPDVSFAFFERFHGLTEEEQQRLPFSPDIVVEVQSPSDSPRNIRRKTQLYLEHGAQLVLNVDPATRTVLLSAPDGERTLATTETIEARALPGLSIPVTALFATLDRLPRPTA